MNERFVRMRWFVGGLLAAGALLLLAGTSDANRQETAAMPADTTVAVAAEAVPSASIPPDDGKLRIICFGAHPDDSELRAGGVGAMWAQRGHHVKFVSCTNGDIGHWAMAGGALAQRRTAEVARCGEILGVTSEVLDIHDGELMPTLENRKIIVRLIRRWKADVVMCHRPNDYHPDHRNVGLLVQDAGYMVTVPFFCPDTPHLRKNPIFLYFEDRFQKPNPFAADVVVGIDPVIGKKLAATESLVSQFLEGGCNGSAELYPDNPAKQAARRQEVRRRFDGRFSATADRFREQLIQWYGPDRAREIRYAEAFEICEYGRRPSTEELRKLFPFLPGS